jgi:hypothetical protein
MNKREDEICHGNEEEKEREKTRSMRQTIGIATCAMPNAIRNQLSSLYLLGER